MAYKIAIDSSNSSENKNGIVEKDFTFTIAKYINERLNNIGIENFLVDENNTGLTDEEKVMMETTNIIHDAFLDDYSLSHKKFDDESKTYNKKSESKMEKTLVKKMPNLIVKDNIKYL